MIQHSEMSGSDLHYKIFQQSIRFGLNFKLKIFRTLSCASGKKIKRENRTLFSSANEAIKKGVCSCGHCMKVEYQKWKNGFI